MQRGKQAPAGLLARSSWAGRSLPQFAREELWKLRLAVGGAALTNLKTLHRWASLDHDAVASLQQERLEGLVHHAFEHVPYYRDLLHHHGVVDGSRIRLENFQRLPLLDKATLREQSQRLKSNDLRRRKLRSNQSGGSTGEPVKLLQDGVYKDWNTATKLFFEGRAGHRPGSRSLLLWGSERDTAGLKRTWRGRLGTALRNEETLNSFLMPEATMREYVERINGFRPSFILAYSESLFRLSRFIEREGLAVHSPDVIFTSATTLYQEMRRTIERVFQAPVYDRYGSREVGVVACEQPGASGYVVSPATHLVEVLRADGSPAATGETGEIVVTVLNNFTMPLLRYRIGDMGSIAAQRDDAEPAWPRLGHVSGRVSDTFFTSDGTQVFGEYFSHLFYERPWVEMFQVVQEEYDLVRVAIVPRQDAPAGQRLAEEFDSLIGQIRHVMGADCRVRITPVDRIESSATGKHRFTISKVAPPTDSGQGGGSGPPAGGAQSASRPT